MLSGSVGIGMPLSLVEDIHARKGNGSYANTGFSKRIGTRPMPMPMTISSIAAKKEERLVGSKGYS